MDDPSLRYLVLFDSPENDEARPVIPLSEFAVANTFYGLDPLVAPILPALRYLLNLPRNVHDLSERSFWMVRELKKLDLPHDIMFVPWPAGRKHIEQMMKVPTLVVCGPGVSADDLRGLFENAILGCVSQEELSVEMCVTHWRQLTALLGSGQPPIVPHIPQLSSPCGGIVAAHTARLISVPNLDIGETLQFSFVRAHHAIDAFALMEHEGRAPGEVKEHIGDARERTFSEFGFSLTVVAPGLPDSLRDAFRGLGTDKKTPASGSRTELEAMDILGAHRAIARNGVHLLLPAVPNELFHALATIEAQYSSRFRNVLKIGRLWAQLGRRVAAFLLKHVERGLLVRCDELLVVSQFPVGIAVLPGATAPLSALHSTFYRPLIPLTRMLQQELPDVPTVYWEDRRPKLVIAECIAKDDPIYSMSSRTWGFVRDEMADAYDVVLEEVGSLEELRRLVSVQHPDILIMSAHGTIGPAANQRSVAVGNELYTGVELPALPPLVLLSACATSPRGAGEVNVADLMLRHGAYGVLCCMVPVDVWHNGRLFVRFLTNIHEARTGQNAMHNVADVWNFTSASNAVLDIVHALVRMPTARGLALDEYVSEFMRTRSVSRIRRTHVYDDTISVLMEMAAERGQAPLLRRLLGNGFLPESQFYMMLGRPERIRLQARELRAAYESLRRQSTAVQSG